jgi:hypothetical protein
LDLYNKVVLCWNLMPWNHCFLFSMFP